MIYAIGKYFLIRFFGEIAKMPHLNLRLNPITRAVPIVLCAGIGTGNFHISACHLLRFVAKNRLQGERITTVEDPRHSKRVPELMWVNLDTCAIGDFSAHRLHCARL